MTDKETMEAYWTSERFYERITTIMKTRGYNSLSALAMDAGLSPATLTRNRNSKSLPFLGTIIKICDLLKCPLSEFFKTEDSDKLDKMDAKLDQLLELCKKDK